MYQINNNFRFQLLSSQTCITNMDKDIDRDMSYAKYCERGGGLAAASLFALFLI